MLYLSTIPICKADKKIYIAPCFPILPAVPVNDHDRHVYILSVMRDYRIFGVPHRGVISLAVTTLYNRLPYKSSVYGRFPGHSLSLYL